MTRVDAVLPNLNVLDVDALKALAIEKTHRADFPSERNRKLAAADLKAEADEVGASSERLARHIDQLELQVENQEIHRASRLTTS
jgi:hypothetical protein